MSKIVIVEDELIAAEYLKELLEKHGFEVLDVIDNGRKAIERIVLLQPDIVLMDIMLKDNISGSEVALHLKVKAPKIAILFLTAYTDEESVSYAIDANCYGYLMKPYNEKEIVNTLKVVLARIKEEKVGAKEYASDVIALSPTLSFHLQKRKLFREKEELKLGKNALRVIEVLCQNSNAVVSKEQLSMEVWGEKKNSITIRTQIYRIRAFLGEDIIKNVSSQGYIINEYDA